MTAETTVGTTTRAAGEIAPEHTDVEVWTAQMMIPHHQQAMEMGEKREMRGMMSLEDMAALALAQGADAVLLHLEHMTTHREGAGDMAHEEIRDGQTSQTIILAEKIVET